MSPTIFQIGPTSTSPDLSLLPDATTSQAPDYTAYDLLDVPGMAAGDSYVDPVSGLTVVKLTDSTFPTANASGSHGAYSDFGNRISLPWGANGDWYTIYAIVYSSNAWLFDYQRGTRTLTNARQLTGSLAPTSADLHFSFSNNPATPRIAYLINGGDLHRIDTEAMTLADTGNFPVDIGSAWTGAMMHDKNDEWFVGAINGADTAIAWNSQSNDFIFQTAPLSPSTVNEVRIDREGGYAVITDTASSSGRTRVWRLDDDTLGDLQAHSVGVFHNSSHRRYWANSDPNGTIPADTVRYALDTGALTLTQAVMHTNGFGPQGFSTGHMSGNYVQSDTQLGGDLTKQWAFGYDQRRNDEAPESWNAGILFKGAVGAMRIDGAVSKFICNVYGYYALGEGYWMSSFVDVSPDGSLVTFTSSMGDTSVLGAGGRTERFLVEMPRS